MTIALASRKALIATLFVPMIAMTAVSMEPAAGLSGAQAQQRGGNDKSDNYRRPYLVQRDCSCRITYHTIGGQRVAVKDCYIEMDGQLRYCSKGTVAVN